MKHKIITLTREGASKQVKALNAVLEHSEYFLYGISKKDLPGGDKLKSPEKFEILPAIYHRPTGLYIVQLEVKGDKKVICGIVQQKKDSRTLHQIGLLRQEENDTYKYQPAQFTSFKLAGEYLNILDESQIHYIRYIERTEEAPYFIITDAEIWTQ